MERLEKITYMCLIAVSLASLGLLLENRFFRPTPPGQLSESALVGRHEATVSDTLWKDSPTNVVLLLSTRCHFCAESTPLYQKLAGLRKQAPHPMSVVVAAFDPPDKMREYLTQRQIAVDNVVRVDAGFAGVSSTPAIFIVDSHGIIRRAFLGKLDWIGERRLMSALGNGGI